jgi:hypothetical protein
MSHAWQPLSLVQRASHAADDHTPLNVDVCAPAKAQYVLYGQAVQTPEDGFLAMLAKPPVSHTPMVLDAVVQVL